MGREAKTPASWLLGHAPGPAPPTLSAYAQQLVERLKEASIIAQHNMELAQSKQKAHYDAKIPHHNSTPYNAGDLVWFIAHKPAIPGTSAKLTPQWAGPASIVKRVGPVNYLV